MGFLGQIPTVNWATNISKFPCQYVFVYFGYSVKMLDFWLCTGTVVLRETNCNGCIAV